ncbi:hypothetical protein CVT91_02150 [Candidatus Atribacteria bacterium HGW-Atribacteria-1]|nr:MAG: hypothetical protein CVT91_02150 [Candidatus Atribacteria bacterium HGW-Atribacteria-1]
MKILHIISFFFPEFSGTSTRLYNLVSRLPYEVDIYTSDRTLNGDKIQCKQQRYNNIYAKRIDIQKCNPSCFAKYIPYLRGKLRSRCVTNVFTNNIKGKEFDIVHGHNLPGFNEAARQAAHRLNKPFVYEIHSLPVADFWSQRNLKALILYFDFKNQENRMLQSSNYIIVQTEMLKKWLCDFYRIKDEKIMIIPNGVDLHLFTPHHEHNNDADILRRKFRIPAEGKVVLYAGYLDKVNGIEIIIKLISQISDMNKNIYWIFVGNGPKQGQIISLVKAFPRHVKYVGMVAYEDMPIYYELCDVFIIPRGSTISGEFFVPLKLLEAMAMRKIILASDVNAIKGIIRHGDNGFLFHKNNLEDLKRALFESLANTQNHRIKEAARTTILQEYNWDSSAKKLKTIYDKLS